MKRLICLVFCVLLVASFLESAYVGKVYFKQQPGQQHKPIFRVPKSFAESWTLRDFAPGKNSPGHRTEQEIIGTFEDQLALLQAYFESEEEKGNLRLRLVQDDPEARMEHRRYRQYYKDLEVFGGEIIKHFKEGQLVGINGEYYEIEDFNTFPLITKDVAVELFKAYLGRSNLTERSEESKLIIYPIKDGDYHLAYQIILEAGIVYSMTGTIDAMTGKILDRYSNFKSDDLTIGIGIGYHGDSYKLPTTYNNDVYWLLDEHNARPVNQYTYVYDLGTYPYDADNNWDQDGVLVNVHAYAGWTYDYYYLAHGRNGIKDNNMSIKAIVHLPGGADNAGWSDTLNAFGFFDPGPRGWQTAGALDGVAHEYSHGVTQYTCNLKYEFQSGALNESFSDIMASAVEFFWQPVGNSFNHAEWMLGEDVFLSYGACIRNLADPNSKGDPCHLSQEKVVPYRNDKGGVHLNSTIYSHAYYLLSEGGTNVVSGKSVDGIGIEKATKIFYRAWVHHLRQSSNFQDAANALLQSAYDLYGSSSDEYAQTIKAMEAIGWTVI